MSHFGWGRNDRREVLAMHVVVSFVNFFEVAGASMLSDVCDRAPGRGGDPHNGPARRGNDCPVPAPGCGSPGTGTVPGGSFRAAVNGTSGVGHASGGLVRSCSGW